MPTASGPEEKSKLLLQLLVATVLQMLSLPKQTMRRRMSNKHLSYKSTSIFQGWYLLKLALDSKHYALKHTVHRATAAFPVLPINFLSKTAKF